MGEPQNPNFYDFGIFGHVETFDIKPTIFIFGNTRTLKTIKKLPHMLKHIICINFKMLETQHFDKFAKDGHRTIPKIRLITILKILDMESKSSRKHEIEIC